ncbi:hypothetical protein [Bradyrhizobium sp. JYMT SZCCT0428]|uniref:hypothetical protein n=1 Tax=Bradyrhizobium sp. JYMT SZCCT0428 TaxID=2807673 RepID=UPI001BA9FB81|nr:hypothetical protein [Bradyrhizobium sp. JYMT SZCCT0428]MBR1155093.1 hypothetical protein [Bradyrhizobium sp. JYMT SZCCT0428]
MDERSEYRRQAIVGGEFGIDANDGDYGDGGHCWHTTNASPIEVHEGQQELRSGEAAYIGWKYRSEPKVIENPVTILVPMVLSD